MNESEPSVAQRIEDLLVDWEVARADGRELSADVLCAESPELIKQVANKIAVLKQLSWASDPDELISEEPADGELADGHLNTPDTLVAANDPTALPDSNVTVQEFVETISNSGVLSDSELTKLQTFVPTDTQQRAYELAKRLVEQNLITNYQARVILERGDSPLLLDRYVILDSIGAGGMGIVFKALQRSLERIVAVKVLPQHATDSPEKVARFQREMRAAAQISHPNVVQAYDAHESNGVYFFAMEYVPGHDLSSLVSETGPLPVPEAIDIIAQAATGLASAHEKGIVHRDVKPSNILLSEQGVAKVLDLGLARTIEIGQTTDRNLTRAGIAMGTVAFMSPEQAFNAKEADEKSDIYSLGCTLYYLLHGRPPFDAANSVQVVIAHRETPAGRLSEGRQDVSPQLDALFQQMVAKQPAQRPASMTEVSQLLLSLDQEVSGQSQTHTEAIPEEVYVASAVSPEITAEARPSSEKPAAKNYWRWLAAGLLLVIGSLAFVAVPKLFPSFGRSTTTNEQLASSTNRELARQLLEQDDVELLLASPDGEIHVSYPEELDDLTDTIEISGAILYPTTSDVGLHRFAKATSLTSITILSGETQQKLKSLSGFEQFTQLDDITIVGYSIEDELIQQLRQASKLEAIDLTTCRLPPDAVVTLASLPQLRGLSLSGTSVSDEDLAAIRTVTKLEWLDLSNTLVTEQGLKQLKGMPNLYDLTLTGLEISRDVDFVTSLPALRMLHLDATELHDDAIAVLSKLPLETLDVSQTKLTAAGMKQIGKMTSLQTLSLRGLPVQESISNLIGLPQLVDLNLAYSDLTDDGLGELRKIKSLQMLCVDSTNVTESELDRFDLRSPNCQIYEEVDESIFE